MLFKKCFDIVGSAGKKNQNQNQKKKKESSNNKEFSFSHLEDQNFWSRKKTVFRTKEWKIQFNATIIIFNWNPWKLLNRQQKKPFDQSLLKS